MNRMNLSHWKALFMTYLASILRGLPSMKDATPFEPSRDRVSFTPGTTASSTPLTNCMTHAMGSALAAPAAEKEEEILLADALVALALKTCLIVLSGLKLLVAKKVARSRRGERQSVRSRLREGGRGRLVLRLSLCLPLALASSSASSRSILGID